MGFSLCVLIALDVWLVRKRARYIEEDARLRESMSGLQRQQADAILSNEQNKVRMMIELVRRQAQIDKQLHLADSRRQRRDVSGAGRCAAARDAGAGRARSGVSEHRRTPSTWWRRAARERSSEYSSARDAWEVPAWVYTDRGLAVPADRALKGALGPAAIVLVGGTVIYSLPSVGPLNDSTYVLPGSVSDARRRHTGDRRESQSRA